jgi:hypothetical protein
MNIANNLVLQFKCFSSNRSINVFSTDEEDRYKIVRGITPRNQITDTSYGNLENIKQLYIDSIVNEYELTHNLLFKRGIMDVFPQEVIDKFSIPVKYKYDENDDLVECD